MGTIIHGFPGAGGGGSGASAMSDLTDVDLTSLSDGNILVYNGTDSKWVNFALSLGTAAAKDSTSSITQGSTDLIESGSVYAALADKVDTSLVGAASGIAELDSSGKVPSSQLPSFVDDVIEVEDYNHLPITGESGKIYVTIDDNKTYRWTGSTYAEISESLALGETSSTAYRGDRGKTAYDHSQDSGRVTAAVTSGLYKVAATAQGHIASLTAVQKSDITGLGIPESDTNTTYTVATGDANGQIKVTPSSGSAYNVGVKGLGSAAYANLANTVMEVGKASSRSTATVGTWTAMCNSSQTGSPKLPVASKWWNVMSLNNWSDSSTNWVSQLAVPTQDMSNTLNDTVWFKHNDATNTSIDSSTWHSLVSGAYVASARFGTTSSTTKIKININSTLAWMLSFVVTLYQGYRATKIMVSGYNYGSNKWYGATAVMLGDSSNSTLNVYFGYDAVNQLWVGFDGNSYTGVAISDVCNGYTQIPEYNGLFTISNVSSLATLQATVVVSGVSISLVT